VVSVLRDKGGPVLGAAQFWINTFFSEVKPSSIACVVFLIVSLLEQMSMGGYRCLAKLFDCAPAFMGLPLCCPVPFAGGRHRYPQHGCHRAATMLEEGRLVGKWTGLGLCTLRGRLGLEPSF